MAATLTRTMLFAAVIMYAVAGVHAAAEADVGPRPSEAPANPISDCPPVRASFNCLNLPTLDYAPEFDRSGNSFLADIGRELLQPAPALLHESSLPQNPVKNLPALPGAVLMGVIGFISITLVRDRKFWISIFAGLFLLSQTGMQTVPKLAARLARGKLPKNQTAVSVSDPYRFNPAFSLNSRYDGIHYVGLLHRLAGSPDEEGAAIKITGEGNILKGRAPVLSAKLARRPDRPRDISFSQPAIIKLNLDRYPSPVFPVRRSKSLAYFSPAFIFANLPRGPPWAFG